MNRVYSNQPTNTVDFFVGREVEKTIMYGRRTLFVVGLQEFEIINTYRIKHDAEHIFFGANHSFKPIDTIDYTHWEDMIEPFLMRDIWCSLDVHLDHAELLLEGPLVEHRTFIPQIRMPLPYIKQWPYHTTIKLDDKGFDSTNPGVWVHSLHELQNINTFTSFSEYNDDEIVKL